MAETLQWYFELVDRISGPATQASKALARTESATEQVGRALDDATMSTKAVGQAVSDVNGRLRDASGRFVGVGRSAAQAASGVDKLGGAFHRAGSSLKSAGFSEFLGGMFGVSLGGPAAWGAAVAAAAQKVAQIGMGVAQMVASGGKFALDTIQFKESTMASLRVMLGTEQAAQRIFGQASTLAAKTPFAIGDVLGGYKRLLAAGFSERELPVVFQAVGDVAAFNDFSPQVIESLARAFGQIKGKAKLQLEELNQVLEASGGAIRRSDIFGNIAAEIGVGVKEVDKAITAGRVSDDVGIFAILKAVEKMSGGAVGSAMLAQGKTLGGLFSTLFDLPRQLFYEMDLSNLPGFSAIKGAVENVIKLFDASSGRLKGVVGDMFNDLFVGIFGDFAGDSGLSRMESMLTSVIGGVKAGWEVVKSIGTGIKGFFEGFWVGIQPALAVFGTGNQLRDFAEGLKQIGRVLGFIVGVLADLSAAALKVGSMFGLVDAVGAASNALPSFGMPSFDTPTVQALKRQSAPTVTANADGGLYNRPTLALVGEAGTEAVVPLRKSRGLGGIGGGPVSVSVSVSVDARGQDGEGIAQKIAAALPSAIADALEGLALEGGVA